MMGALLNSVWEEMERTALEDMEREGFRSRDIELQQVAYLRYGQQIDDVEVVSPTPRIESAEDMDRLLAAFEDLYARIYTEGARYPEWGYTIMELGIIARAPKVKPAIRSWPLEGKEPPDDARKGTREVYRRGEWVPTALYEMDRLRPGNRIDGPAIVEAPSTTLVVPRGRTISMDEFRVLWMTGGAS
jgi:N-methylhydantoinase A/oxoprolinase/acetone carboxylase beta subunit